MCPHVRVVLLGTLGPTTWGRCQNCGIDVDITGEYENDKIMEV